MQPNRTIITMRHEGRANTRPTSVCTMPISETLRDAMIKRELEVLWERRGINRTSER